MGTFWRHTISSPYYSLREMSSEGVHARTRSSERLDVQNPGGAMGSTSPPTTTTSGAATATATGGGGGSSATNKVVGATKASSSSSSSSMLQFSEHAINQVQGLSKRGLDLPITARLQRRRYRWDYFLLFFVFFSVVFFYLFVARSASLNYQGPFPPSQQQHPYLRAFDALCL